MLKKKIWASFQRIIELLPKNLSLSSKKYGAGIRDPGSVKNLFRIQIPDPGPAVKKAPDPGSATLVLSNAFCHFFFFFNIRRRAACLRRWRATWPAWRAGSQARAGLRQPETPGPYPFLPPPFLPHLPHKLSAPIHPSFSAYSPFLRSGSFFFQFMFFPTRTFTHCCGSASPWSGSCFSLWRGSGSGSYLSLWCGFGSYLSIWCGSGSYP